MLIRCRAKTVRVARSERLATPRRISDRSGPKVCEYFSKSSEAIIDHARRFVWEKGIGKESFEFQMLYGVRRDLQTRLREEGYNVRVYVPFGDSWYPYLMRRLAERPANVLFMAGNILKESGAGRFLNPAAIGAGIVAGAAGALAWKARRRKPVKKTRRRR